MTKLESINKDFEQALARLDEVLAMEKTDVVRDSAIQRFEIVFELAWKTLKAYLEEYHAASCASPRHCFREAFRIGLIEHDEAWFSLIVKRNQTAHIYNAELAEEVYNTLPHTLIYFQKLRDAINAQK